MKAKHILMSMLIVMLFGGVSSCTQKQENKILDIVSPRKIIGHRTVYKYNFLTDEVEEVLRSQPIYLDGDGEVIYIEIDDDRMGFHELNDPIYVDGVVLRYAAYGYCVENLPAID